MQAALPLGPYGSADSMTREVSVVGKDAMWQAQGENHNGVKGLWGKAMKSAGENCAPFEDNPLCAIVP